MSLSHLNLYLISYSKTRSDTRLATPNLTHSVILSNFCSSTALNRRLTGSYDKNLLKMNFFVIITSESLKIDTLISNLRHNYDFDFFFTMKIAWFYLFTAILPKLLIWIYLINIYTYTHTHVFEISGLKWRRIDTFILILKEKYVPRHAFSHNTVIECKTWKILKILTIYLLFWLNIL